MNGIDIGFETVLGEYNGILLYMHYRKRSHTEEYWKAFYEGASRMFRALKDMSLFSPETRSSTLEEKEQMKDPETGEGPVSMIDYRGEKIPIYVDDAGQQFYTIYKGHTWGTGAYNLFPEKEICDFVDSFIDQDIIENGEKTE